MLGIMTARLQNNRNAVVGANERELYSLDECQPSVTSRGMDIREKYVVASPERTR